MVNVKSTKTKSVEGSKAKKRKKKPVKEGRM